MFVHQVTQRYTAELKNLNNECKMTGNLIQNRKARRNKKIVKDLTFWENESRIKSSSLKYIKWHVAFD